MSDAQPKQQKVHARWGIGHGGGGTKGEHVRTKRENDEVGDGQGDGKRSTSHVPPAVAKYGEEYYYGCWEERAADVNEPPPESDDCDDIVYQFRNQMSISAPTPAPTKITPIKTKESFGKPKLKAKARRNSSATASSVGVASSSGENK